MSESADTGEVARELYRVEALAEISDQLRGSGSYVVVWRDDDGYGMGYGGVDCEMLEFVRLVVSEVEGLVRIESFGVDVVLGEEDE